MSRYIDADMLLNSFKGAKKLGVDAIKYYVENTPTIDLVRCGECIWFDTDNLGDTYCTYGKGLADAKADDFCSHGERGE